MSTPTELAHFLSSFMRAEGLTLRDMESRTGVSKSLLNNLINGKVVEPRLSTLVGIARAVDLPLWRVIDLAGFDLGLPTSPEAVAEVRARSAATVPHQRWCRLLERLAGLDPDELDALLSLMIAFPVRASHRTADDAADHAPTKIGDGSS